MYATIPGLHVLTSISFILLVTVHNCSAANILILGFPIYTDIIGPVNVGQVLQQQGHNVTVAVPPHLQDLVVEKGLNVLLYHSIKGFEGALQKSMDDLIHIMLLGNRSYESGAEESLTRHVRQIMDDDDFNKAMLATKPDLFIFDPDVPSQLFVTLTCKLKVPFVFIGQTIFGQFARVPLLSTVVPHRLLDATDQMSFAERFANSLTALLFHYYAPLFPRDIVSVYCPERPGASIQEIHAKASLWIEVHDSILDYNKPIMPNIKQVSNLLPVTREPLPQELQAFMDNAEYGLVIVSFGSILTSIPVGHVEKMIQAFKRTSYKYLIRYLLKNFTDSQILTVNKWMPQLELLCHNHTRLFITHGGTKSQQDAIYAGVPMIGTPIVFDQFHNTARVVRKGFGLRLDLRSFTVEELVNAIEEVITNPKYKARTRKASAIVRAARVPPVEEAAFWINHVLTFGDEHLKSLAQDVPLWKYLGLDILAFCLLVWHLLLLVVIKIIYIVCGWCCTNKPKLKTD